ncbi:uncharacterized protein LOC110830502 [Zootermopsis nevadensis]|uniref:uncharacterized protein LOC110830502 n=1 Tax=Zootermopsis nevadensis TaxID=136037 RepID=UPI000B8ECFDD|nr:uncharacterized protein LOC110830502 [Zootermopsis nevadensis]
MECRDLCVSAFETSPATSSQRRRVRFDMKGIFHHFSYCIRELPLLAPHPTVPHDVRMLSHTRKLQLADPKNDSEDLPIEILIGGDNYWKIVKDASPIRLTSSVVLIPSKLGWVLSGNRSGITVNFLTVNYVKLNTSSPSEDILRRFWDLETIGIMENQGFGFTSRVCCLILSRGSEKSGFVSQERKCHCTQQPTRGGEEILLTTDEIGKERSS